MRFVCLFVIAGCASSSDRIEAHLSWHQESREIVDCHYFKLDNDEPIDVGRFTVDFPLGSHHVHLYRSETPEPDGVVGCSAGIDWMRWRLLVAVQNHPIDWRLPDGVATRIEPHQQLMVQVHWVNATQQPLSSRIDIAFERALHPVSRMATTLAVSQDVAMKPNETKAVGGWFGLPEGTRLLRAMGHYHDRGFRYRAYRLPWGGQPGAPIYESLGRDNFEFSSLADQGPLAAGEGISYACDFENDTPGDISWGPDTLTQEHCNLALYYYLPDGDAGSGVPISGRVQALDAPNLAIVGEKMPLQVTLIRPAGPDGTDVQLSSSDPSLLELPARVHVPPWSDRVSFEGIAQYQGEVRLTATTGANSVETTLTLR